MTTQKEDQELVFKTNYGLMQVKSIAECSKGEHSAILLTFIKPPFAFKTFVLSIFEWLFLLYIFQMRPDIKKDVFHLNWAPEAVPADSVCIQ